MGRSSQFLTIPLVVDLTDRRPAPLTEGPLREALVAAPALAGLFRGTSATRSVLCTDSR